MALTKEQITEFTHEYFPEHVKRFTIEEVGNAGVRLRYKIQKDSLRPGGTVSGPTLMLIADFALYAAILGQCDDAYRAVTTNLSFNFFRRATADDDIEANCKLLKIGKKLVTGEVSLYAVNSPDEVIAHAVGTFAL